MPGVAQETVRDLGQGVIQLAFRVCEFFCTIDNQNVAHYLSSVMRVWRVFYARGRCGKISKMCKVFCVKCNNPLPTDLHFKAPFRRIVQRDVHPMQCGNASDDRYPQPAARGILARRTIKAFADARQRIR